MRGEWEDGRRGVCGATWDLGTREKGGSEGGVMGEDLRACVASDGGGRCASTCATLSVCPGYLVSIMESTHYVL